MNADTFLFATTLVISLTSLIFVALNFKKGADKDEVSDLRTRLTSAEARLATNESRLTDCEHARANLAEENIRLMRKVLGLPEQGEQHGH